MTRNEDEETKPGNAEDKLEHAQMPEQVRVY